MRAHWDFWDCWLIIGAFLIGLVIGAEEARVECIKERCAVPCGLRQVRVNKDNLDWTKWTCTCAPE